MTRKKAGKSIRQDTWSITCFISPIKGYFVAYFCDDPERPGHISLCSKWLVPGTADYDTPEQNGYALIPWKDGAA